VPTAARSDQVPPAPATSPPPIPADAPLRGAERRLRGLLWGHAALSVAFAVGYLAGGDVTTLGFIPNSIAKDGLFAILSVLGAAHVRRRGWTALVLAAAYGCLVLGQVATLLIGDVPGQDVLGIHVSGTVALLAWMAVDLVVAAWMVAWWLAAERARHGLRCLNAIAFHGLAGLADVLIEGPDERVSPTQIARNVDAYLADLRASGKARVQLALTVLGLLPPWLPLPLRSPGAREAWLRRHFLDDLTARRVPRPLRPVWQALIRTASQMAYLGYYGDRAAWPAIGYVPFVDRPGGRPPRPEDHPFPRLQTLSAPPRRTRFDTVIVGSGAAGSILAYRFAERGRRVLLLERGPHVDPRDFTDDEVGQYLRLYNEGALQLATDFRLQVLQGVCVGGGTTINNGVCLDPPPAILDAWERRGIDRAGLEHAVAQVRGWLDVRRISPDVVSAGADRFARGARALQLPGTLQLVEANLRASCLGCGYCNIGCAYGQRQSMLDVVLPAAQHGLPGRVEVLPDFRATAIVHDGDVARGVLGEHAGHGRACIEADEIVVAAGALGSSWLLQRSGIGADRPGAELYFNINSPVTAEFPEPVDTFAGLQMTHAYTPPGDEPAYVLETWFNPPATQALAMPGWFDRHFANMRRYRHMAAGGALVGTTHPGSVRASRSGPVIRYDPSREDLGRVVDGVKLIGRIFLAAGAQRVMPATFAWHEYASAAGLDALDDRVRDNADLLLTSAHPQGGNPVGDPGEGGVVDPDFRVHGFRNLWLCDASVFPSSVSVNPQLTVMAMAQYAAARIVGPAPEVSQWRPPAQPTAPLGSPAPVPRG
jgi:choline dehydrogenase-like flavoprotein